MFKIGDFAYIVEILDFSPIEETLQTAQIKKLKIDNIIENKVKLVSGFPTIPRVIDIWGLNKTIEDANKMAITFLINKLEFGKIINDYTIKDYEDLEKKHPELIFKYLERVKIED